MAEPNAKPKTGGRKPKPKPTPEGQSTMDFNKQAPWGKPGAGTARTSAGISAKQSEKIALSSRSQSNATSRPTGKNRYFRDPGGISGTPRYASINQQYNAIGPNHPKTRAGMGGRPDVSSPVSDPGEKIIATVNRQPTTVYTPGKNPPPPPPSGVKPSPGVALVHQPENFHARGSNTYRKVAPPAAPPSPGVSSGVKLLPGKVAPITPKPIVPKGLSLRNKGRLLGFGTVLAGLGAGYLMTRRNENEDAAKPQQAGTSMNIPGRNAPPSEGNRADRELYSPAPEGSTKKADEPGLSERVRNNQKANRSPDDYLGEAFDATVKRGRDVGRKHLQGMLVRDSVDNDTATKLMNRYDKEIGAQKTLRDYKSEGIAQKFDRENPGKAGRILDEYRSMGRREGAAPAGATYAQIKERALR